MFFPLPSLAENWDLVESLRPGDSSGPSSAVSWQGGGVSKAHRQRASLEDYEVPANGGAI